MKIRRKVMLGNKTEKILGVADEENIDLVVLTIQKQSIFAYLMARGKLLKVISRLSCPVLLTPCFGVTWPRFGIIGSSLFAR